jgi:hypothetical protein
MCPLRGACDLGIVQNMSSDLRYRLEDRIRRKEQEVQGLEHQIAVAREALRAYRETLQLAIRSDSRPAADSDALRAGSTVFKARKFLQKQGEPQHISAIVEGIGRVNNTKNRAALAGSISSYVRRGQIFTRPLSNTFGLLEWGQDGPSTVREDTPTETA